MTAKTSSSPSPAASTPASACPTCRSAAGTCTPCSPTPAASTPRSAPSSKQRAAELGVASHVTVDGGPAIWDGFVKPFVWAGEGYQGQYPLLVSDRYLIVDAALQRCARARHQGHRARLHRHGQRPGALRPGGEGAGRLRDRRADPRNPEGAHRGPRLRAEVPRGARLRRARQAEGVHDQREPARPDHVRRRDRPLGGAGRRRARLVRAARANGRRSRCR